MFNSTMVIKHGIAYQNTFKPLEKNIITSLNPKANSFDVHDNF